MNTKKSSNMVLQQNYDENMSEMDKATKNIPGL